MRQRRLLTAVLILLFLSGMAFPADKPPAGLKKIASVEGITEYRLKNGLKVLLFPDPSTASVTVNLTVFVGSRHEGYGEAGMAHLLEHMLFKGTPTHPDIPEALTARGAHFNGTTWLDRTNYFETLPAQGDNLEFALRLEADRLVNSSIKAEDLASEMTVVRNEFERGENNPFYILSQRMMSAAYQWHNYGKATIGNRADIERVPIENLRRFYRKYYQPDNAMLVVSGKFDPQQALALIARYFGPLPRPERKLENTYTQEPPQDGERFVTLRRVGDVALVGVLYHIPAGPHPDYPAIDVLESTLTAEPAGRLYKALVETKKAAAVFGEALALHDPGVLRLYAQVSPGNEPKVVLDAMLDAIDEVRDNGVSKEEVERARRRLLSQFERAVTDSRRIAIQLSEWAAQGDWRLMFLYRDNVEKVTAADVNRVAKTYLQPNNRTVGLFIPTKEPQRVAIPPSPNVAELVAGYKGRESIAVGEAFDVSPQNIEKRTKRLTLPSGIKAALLPKQTRGNMVHLRLTLRYGNEQNLEGLAKACEFLPHLMTRGTENYTRQQLQDELDRLQARLSPSGDAGKLTFTIQVKRDNLLAVLKLLEEVLRRPTLPADELDILKREEIASLEQQLTEPQVLASVAVRRVLNRYPKGDPRYVPTVAEEIELVKGVSRQDLQKLYEEYLGSEHGQLVVVGDFDSQGVLSAVNKILAEWKAKRPYKRLPRRHFDVAGGQKTIQTPGKESAFYFAATAFPMRDDHPDYPALEIGNFILGGGTLSSRLADRIRQKEGLSYGVGSGLQVLSLDERAAFYIYASAKPENIAKVEAAVREEVERLLADGITSEELATAKQGYLQKQQVQRTNDAYLASLLEETLLADRTLQFTAKVENTIRQLKIEDVNRALRKYIDPNRLYVVEAGDFGARRTGAGS